MFSEINKEEYENLPLVLCAVAIDQEQREIIREHGFIYHQFIWVSSGSGIFTVGEKTFELSDGEGMFFRKNVPHSYKDDKSDFFTSWLTFDGCDSLLDHFKVNDYFKFTMTKTIAAQSKELLTACKAHSTVLTRSASTYSWIISTLSEIFEPSMPFDKKAKQFMENHYQDPISLDDIAKHVGMNRFALCREFSKKNGVSLMEQLKNIRVSKAKYYLKYSTNSIEEIGILCGFDSPSYFGKRFKEITNLSPREYRNLK